MKLDHISYATRDTDASIRAFRPLYDQVEVYRALEPSQRVYYSYLTSKQHGHRVELVEPASAQSPVERVLQGQALALYHVSYRVDAFQPAVKYFKENRFFMVTSPFRPELDPSTKVCHFYHPDAGLFEVMGPDAVDADP
jgi:Glyoxalase/Bleomycin resistance protein/Dioxygenase superfamily